MINKYFKIAWCLKNTWLMINKYFKIAWCLKNTWIKILPQVFQQVFKDEFLCGFSPTISVQKFCVCPCMSALHSIFSTCPTCTACVLLWRHVPKNFLSATGGTLEKLQSGITMASDNRIDSWNMRMQWTKINFYVNSFTNLLKSGRKWSAGALKNWTWHGQ